MKEMCAPSAKKKCVSILEIKVQARGSWGDVRFTPRLQGDIGSFVWEAGGEPCQKGEANMPWRICRERGGTRGPVVIWLAQKQTPACCTSSCSRRHCMLLMEWTSSLSLTLKRSHPALNFSKWASGMCKVQGKVNWEEVYCWEAAYRSRKPRQPRAMNCSMLMRVMPVAGSRRAVPPAVTPCPRVNDEADLHHRIYYSYWGYLHRRWGGRITYLPQLFAPGKA